MYHDVDGGNAAPKQCGEGHPHHTLWSSVRISLLRSMLSAFHWLRASGRPLSHASLASGDGILGGRSLVGLVNDGLPLEIMLASQI